MRRIFSESAKELRNTKSLVIMAMLLALAMFIISRYELTDEVIDKINMEIEKRNN